MDYQRIFTNALKQNNRNKFEEYSGSLTIVPDKFIEFYRNNNPIRGYAASNLGDIWFSPAESLEELQSEFSYLNAQFVFATNNGDPIFFHDGQVYICPHGVEDPEWELIDLVDVFGLEIQP